MTGANWRKAGFTLVEVLVASAIGTFIALVAVGALRAITLSAEMVEQNIDTAAEVRFAAKLIADDLTNIYRDRNTDNIRLVGTTAETKQSGGSILTLYTVGRAKARTEQAEGDVYEVEYFLAVDEQESVLCRRLWPNPDKDTDPGGVLTIIAEDIDIFEIRFFDGEDWTDEWTEEMKVLPQLVEVTIVTKQPSRVEPAIATFVANFSRFPGQASGTAEATEQGGGEESR
jgi:general secretion pathway protein J